MDINSSRPSYKARRASFFSSSVIIMGTWASAYIYTTVAFATQILTLLMSHATVPQVFHTHLVALKDKFQSPYIRPLLQQQLGTK